MLAYMSHIQFLFAAKGLYLSWDHLGDISAAVGYLQKIKKQVSVALGCYSRTKHTTPDTSALVWKVTDKVKELELQIFKSQHQGNDTIKPVVDITGNRQTETQVCVACDIQQEGPHSD